MPETFDLGPLWEGGKKTEPEPAETDELGRPKPDPKCYLKDGDWWYKGAPWGYDDTGCPPDCPNCEREKIKAEVIAEMRKRVTAINPESDTLKILDDLEQAPQ